MARSWSDEENRLVAGGYMEIVEHEAASSPFSKKDVYDRIAASIGRTPKAVEFKMLNVSGALEELGLGFASGLTPFRNFQRSLVDSVEEALNQHPDVRQYLTRSAGQGAAAPTPAPALPPSDEDENESSESSEELRVQDLWAFAVGGSDVAAVPGRPTSAPIGPRPAGVETGASWMAEALQPGFQGANRYLFLVGGPGAGKSDVAAQLTAALRAVDNPHDGLAHRTYRYDAPTRPLLLVNDATIPVDGAKTIRTLAADLTQACRGHVIACVNRGVLVDEEPREEKESLGALLTTWLRTGKTGTCAGWTLASAGSGDTDYLRQATAAGPRGERVDAVAIFVDVCSLFEDRPRATKEDVWLVGGTYEIATFVPGLDRDSSPAGQFLDMVCGRLGWEEEGNWDPIRANLDSLSSPSVRRGICSILRAAELATSQRFTYRQLWGVISRMVAGPLPELINADDLQRWMRQQEPSPGKSPLERFECLRDLASVRLHEAVFGEEWTATSRHPILSATTVVDPCRDMQPGDPRNAGHGWASPVSEAFAASQLGTSPLTGLIEEAASDALDAFVTRFDATLDDAFVRAVEVSQDSDWISRNTAWYGRYLSRMLAVAHGYPAYSEQLMFWTKAWAAGAVEDELARGLDALVRPPRFAGAHEGLAQVPLYGSRAEAVLGTPDQPLLVAGIGRLSFTTDRQGEDLFLHIRREHTTIGRVRLDLDLVREALVCADGWLGMTDATESVVPRLERFRSINLIPENRDPGAVSIVGPSRRDHSITVPSGWRSN